MNNEEGNECWAMLSEAYCTSAVTNVEDNLQQKGLRLPPKCVSPLSSEYRREMDATVELNTDGVQWYQEITGQLR